MTSALLEVGADGMAIEHERELRRYAFGERQQAMKWVGEGTPYRSGKYDCGEDLRRRLGELCLVELQRRKASFAENHPAGWLDGPGMAGERSGVDVGTTDRFERPQPSRTAPALTPAAASN